MKRDYSVPMAVQMAEEVLAMHHELERLRTECAELREYRERYMQELHNGIAHSQHMIGGLLELAMKPGVLDAVAAANERAEPIASACAIKPGSMTEKLCREALPVSRVNQGN